MDGVDEVAHPCTNEAAAIAATDRRRFTGYLLKK
jgi:hypothetical protein